jgi:hypothetical protein
MIFQEYSLYRYVDMGAFGWEFSQGSVFLRLLSQKLSPSLFYSPGSVLLESLS